MTELIKKTEIEENELPLDERAAEINRVYEDCRIELVRIVKCASAIFLKNSAYFGEDKLVDVYDTLKEIVNAAAAIENEIGTAAVYINSVEIRDSDYSEMNEIIASALFVADEISEVCGTDGVSEIVSEYCYSIEHDARELQKMVKNKGDEK